MGTNVVPPLPPGFKLDPVESKSSKSGQIQGLPPLPPGFKLDAAPQSKTPGIFSRTAQAISGGITEVLQGMGAGVMSTGVNLYDLARKPFGGNPVAENPEVKKYITPPASAMGKIGFFGEQAAEIGLMPEISEMGIAKIAKGSKLAKAALGTAQEAGRVGGAQYLQTGGDTKQALTAAATAGGISAFGKALGPALGSMGRKIQASTIRPNGADLRDGFKWSTLDRFKLKGNLEQSINQVDTELTKLRTERNALIAPGTANVDIGKALTAAGNELKTQVGELKHAGVGGDVIEQFKKLQTDILKYSGSPVVDIRIAENAKESIGLLGSWAQGMPDKDAAAIEKAANAMYFQLKTEIEQALGPQGAKVKILNAQMQDLIPVKKAMLRRLPVEERNRMFSLADLTALIPALVSGNPADLALLGVTRGQKSLAVGNLLTRTAEKTPKLMTPVGRVASEATR